LAPPVNILVRIVEIAHTMADGGFRNQLHEPYRPAFEITIGLKEDSAFMTARSKAVERGAAEPHG